MMADSVGPEMKRLLERLKGVHFHVDWEPGAQSLTPEERAAELNRCFDEIENGRAVEIGPDTWMPKEPRHDPHQ